MEKASKIFSRINRKFEKNRARRLAPKFKNSNDYYLVEYPKSGVTWLSVLLANLFLRNQGCDHRATFSSVRSYIPDLHVTRSATALEFRNPQVRLYKSHSTFQPEYINIIYIARSPVQVMQSYFRYQSGLGHFSGTFEEFCFGRRQALEEWRRHVHSWLRYPHNGDQHFIHLVRYEDLIEDTADQLRTIAENFGWTISSEALDFSVMHSERSAMRRQEELYRTHNPAYRTQFVSASPNPSPPEGLSDRIVKECRDELQLLGYSSAAGNSDK